MLLLASTSDLVQIITTNAVATHIQTSWVDNNAGAITPGRTNTIVSTATTTTIVGSPGASIQRNIQFVSVRAVGGAQGVTIQHTDGTTVVQIINLSLAAGELLVFTNTGGWQVLNSGGSLKTSNSTSGAFTILNVKDYGAVGDGSTNDTTAIQNAINAAGAAGVSGRGVDLYFPAGIYAVNTTLTCNFNNITLRGSGQQSTVIYCTVTTGDVLQFGNGVGSFGGCGLMDMSVWKSAGGTTGSNINVNKMNDVNIRNFIVNNCFVGITVQGASIKVSMDDGEVNNITATTGVGVQVTNGLAGDTYMTDLIMSNNPASKPAAGIQITQTGHTSILRCNVTSCVIGLNVNPGAAQDVNYLFIDHSLFDSGGTHGVKFAPTNATGRIRSVMSINGWYSGTTAAGGAGIEIAGVASSTVDGLTFIGARVLSNFGHGVLVNYASAQNISFTDCTIAGNGIQTSNTFDGVNIIANVNNVSFINCGIGQQGTAANQQRFAINIAAGTSANIQLLDNQCSPNGTVGTHGFINCGTLTGGGNLIDGNSPQPSTGMAVSTVAASAAINTAETVISSPLRFSANALHPQTSLYFRIAGSCTITTAAAVPTFRVRMGTAGTTADGVIMTFTLPTSGGVGTSAFVLDVTLTCRTAGATGTFEGDLLAAQGSATLGLLSTIAFAMSGTAATGNTQNANFVTVTYQGASANVTCTFQKVMTQVVVP